MAVIVLLVGCIFYQALNRFEKVEDDYREMRELKGRAEAADVAKSQVLISFTFLSLQKGDIIQNCILGLFTEHY